MVGVLGWLPPMRRTFLFAAAVIALISAFGFIITYAGFTDRFYASPFVLGVAFVALNAGRAAGWVAAVMSWLTWEIVFQPPYWLATPTVNEIVVWVTLFGAAHLIGGKSPPFEGRARGRFIGHLPFVRDKPRDEDRDSRVFWDVIASGDWQSDCDVGQEYGRLYLHRLDAGDAPLLGWIFRDMVRTGHYGGIEAGFCAIILRRVRASRSEHNPDDPNVG